MALSKIEVCGNSEKHNGYLTWEVHIDGHMVSSFFGPMSFAAAMSFVKCRIEDKQHISSNSHLILGEMTRSYNSYYTYI